MAVNDRYIQVDSQGNLVLPAEVAAQFGLVPGARAKLDEGPNGILLYRPVTHLARVYVEPTSRCNLSCPICIRNAWRELHGQMSHADFDRLLEGLQSFSPVPSVFFGGFGEPLLHPDIYAMIREVKRLGGAVELITNGTLLDEAASRSIMEAGLDTLWVSVDGPGNDGHAGTSYGGYKAVLADVERLQRRKRETGIKNPQVGVSFVAMNGNAAGFPELLRWGLRQRIKKYSISNLLPYTFEMKGQTLFQRSLHNIDYAEVQLPRFDAEEGVLKLLAAVIREDCLPRFEELASERRRDCCPFVARGSTSVRWDGAVSPCLPLLHSHESLLADRLRRIENHTVGRLSERSLKELWEDPGYVSLRKRLRDFDFPPCSCCNSCEYPDYNREDCYGSPAPTCGGCLWAQGFIRCP